MDIAAQIHKNYPVRNRRLAELSQNEPVRDQVRLHAEGQECVVCRRSERGGGVFGYRSRDGQEFLVGERCAAYLDYLSTHPAFHRDFLRNLGH
jgi:hypothetical protein